MNEKTVKIIKATNNHRVAIRKVFRDNTWKWYALKQKRLLWIFWLSSSWGNEQFFTISYKTSYEDAKIDAMKIVASFIKNL